MQATLRKDGRDCCVMCLFIVDLQPDRPKFISKANYIYLREPQIWPKIFQHALSRLKLENKVILRA